MLINRIDYSLYFKQRIKEIFDANAIFLIHDTIKFSHLVANALNDFAWGMEGECIYNYSLSRAEENITRNFINNLIPNESPSEQQWEQFTNQCVNPQDYYFRKPPELSYQKE